MRSKCAMSLPDRVKPISGRPDRPAASSDLSCAAPAAASPITASAHHQAPLSPVSIAAHSASVGASRVTDCVGHRIDDTGPMGAHEQVQAVLKLVGQRRESPHLVQRAQ